MERRKRITLSVAALGALGLGLTAAAAAAPLPMQWSVDGVERQALVFAPPPGAAGPKVPLVFAFHGHGGTMQTAAHAMRLQDHWPAAVVVYPQGLPTPSPVDPQGRRPGWQRAAGELGDRDLKLVDAMLASLKAKYPIADRRIYATGFSNGAFFSYLLWAERGKTFAAFAPCAGRLVPTLHLTEPRPLLAVAGENDPLVHLADVQQTIETVRALDGATGAGQSCGARCTLYPSTKNAPVVTFIHPGGHVYPPWASAKVVEFFKAHPLAP